MPHILVTNDDGVDAPGILALARAMRSLGTVEVAAPAHNQSGSGHRKTLYMDIPVEEKMLDGDIPTLVVHSSPADCIAIAAKGMRTWPPRIVVSGINRGENLSQDVTYSGTVTAALESTINGVPAVAVSLAKASANSVEEYEEAARIAALVVQQVMERGLPPLTILNVNVPADKAKAMRLTRQGIRVYHDELQRDGDVVRMVGEPPTGDVEEFGTDIWAVHNGYVSVTPIHLNMTSHHFMADLANWNITI